MQPNNNNLLDNDIVGLGSSGVNELARVFDDALDETLGLELTETGLG